MTLKTSNQEKELRNLKNEYNEINIENSKLKQNEQQIKLLKAKMEKIVEQMNNNEKEIKKYINIIKEAAIINDSQKALIDNQNILILKHNVEIEELNYKLNIE